MGRKAHLSVQESQVSGPCPYDLKTLEELVCFPTEWRTGRPSASAQELALRLLHVPEPQQREAEVEANRRRLREAAGERAEPRERSFGRVLAVTADGGGGLGLGIAGSEPGRLRENPLGRDGTAEPLQRDPVEELRVCVGPPRVPAEQRELGGRVETVERRRRLEPRDERRQPGRLARVEQVARTDREDRVGLDLSRRAPLAGGLGVASGPEVRQPQVEAHGAALRPERRELLEPTLRAPRPAGEREPDPSLDRAVAPEDARRVATAAVGVEDAGSAQGPGLRVGADAQVEDERRRPLPAATSVVAARQHAGPYGDRRGRHCGDGDEGEDPHPRRHAFHGNAVAILTTCPRSSRASSSTRRPHASCSSATRTPCWSTCAARTSGPAATSPAPSSCRYAS